MTFATQLTVFRILMIPVFVLFCVYYGESVARGQPQEWQRLAAIAVFILAAITDGLDGYIARHWNQRSRLGAILDPIADKGLLLTAIITLNRICMM
jgi:CDP-diacylglycerol--glycerol-3-phosphate 3-phosphatidyltransferase